MNIRYAATMVGLVFILAGVPAFVAAELVEVVPIRIDSVEIDQSYGAFYEFEPEVLNVAFTNTDPKTATDVVFNLVGDDGLLIAQYDDPGNFAQNATVLQRFPDGYFESGQHLEVGHVRFADGSTWTAPSTLSLLDPMR
jgi:hypothetical protein